MVLSKREQQLAIGAGATLGCLLLYFLAISPNIDQWYAVKSDKADADKQLRDADSLFALQTNMQRVWSDMQKGGLKADASQAESQALNTVLDYASKSGVSLTGLKPERSVTQGKFQVIGFTMTGSGSMQQISQLVWLMESTTIPMQMIDLQVTPRREATDDLSVRLSFTTLCQIPGGDKPDRNASGGNGARI